MNWTQKLECDNCGKVFFVAKEPFGVERIGRANFFHCKNCMGLKKFTQNPTNRTIFNPDYERLTETGVVSK